MDTASHMNFMARGFLQVSQYFTDQLPPDYEVQIDPDAFLRSISFKENNNRVTVPIWDNAPGFRSQPAVPNSTSEQAVQISQATRRGDIIRKWRIHFNKFASVIPYSVIKGQKYDIDEKGDLITDNRTPKHKMDVLGRKVNDGTRQPKGDKKNGEGNKGTYTHWTATKRI